MTLSPEMIDRVRRLDEAYAQAPAPGFERVLDGVSNRGRRRRRRAVGAGVGMLALASAALAWLVAAPPRAASESALHAEGSSPAHARAEGSVERAERTPAASEEAESETGLPVISGACASQRSGESFSLDGDCLVAAPSPSMRMHSRGSVVLRHRANGFDLVRGRVSFDVDPIPTGTPPVEIGVGEAIIRVIGTQFVVEVAGADGSVDLIEGAIEFRDAAGQWHDVVQGRRLAWEAGLPVVSEDQETDAPAPAPSAAAVAKAPAIPEDIDRVLARVARLRTARRYEEALAELDELRGRVKDRRTSETLSYERATVVEAAMPGRACAEWARHQARYPDGRYSNAAERRRTKLQCP